MLRISVLCFVLLLSNNLWAKKFSNGFIAFELPTGWECVIEGSEWVCQSNTKERKKEAIIILAAKKRGPQDNLAEYQKYLKQQKTYSLPGAKTQISEPKSVKQNTIRGLPWIDALHMASEVPGFYTRYLATVKADIGVAVTFSVTKSLYRQYKDTFDRVIASMRIIRQKQINPAAYLGKGKRAGDDVGEVTFDPGTDLADIGAGTIKKRKGSDGEGEDMLIFIIIAAIAGFVIMKKLKKGKKGGKKKKKA